MNKDRKSKVLNKDISTWIERARDMIYKKRDYLRQLEILKAQSEYLDAEELFITKKMQQLIVLCDTKEKHKRTMSKEY